MTFQDNDDYDKISEDDRISITQLNEFSEGKPVKCDIKHSDETCDTVLLNHSYNTSQIEWFRAGSAMNVLRQRQQN